ncbi:MAG: hypothetical protein GXW91_10320, partial [Clostridiales bacterium]|nr:hypothetical protein [Clostridiales bacterium]
METLNLDDFIALKKQNEDKAKKYLADYWKTTKLIARVDSVNENSKGNKFTIVKYPSDLYGNNINNPFAKNPIDTPIDNCYVNLNQIKDKVEEGCYIIFEFDINYEDKLGEDKLIRGGYSYIDVVTDYKEILESIAVNSDLYCDLLDKNEKINANI